MKRSLWLPIVFGFVLIIQGCAIYPHDHSVYNGNGPYYGYQPHGYQPYRNLGWGGSHYRGSGYNRGFGGGGHHGWGGGHDHD
ncbi:MAG: hypothetical protein LUQ26_12160 [Methylococcaceae bacterium]|nr:hypothetical protein [Methylococcaceae bacterium]